MFVGRPELVAGCMIKAHDDASLERLLVMAMKNWLKDQAKATEVGKLRRRLESVLGKDPRFVAVKTGHDRWALAGQTSMVWQGDIDELHAAAHRVAWRADHAMEHIRPDTTRHQGRTGCRGIRCAVGRRRRGLGAGSIQGDPGTVPAAGLARPRPAQYRPRVGTRLDGRSRTRGDSQSRRPGVVDSVVTD
jgi:hypothetical protein